jgi:hypothetical protein
MTRFCFTAALIVASAAVHYFVLTISPAHSDAAAVPSSAAGAAAERYSGAVGEHVH